MDMSIEACPSATFKLMCTLIFSTELFHILLNFKYPYLCNYWELSLSLYGILSILFFWHRLSHKRKHFRDWQSSDWMYKYLLSRACWMVISTSFTKSGTHRVPFLSTEGNRQRQPQIHHTFLFFWKISYWMSILYTLQRRNTQSLLQARSSWCVESGTSWNCITWKRLAWCCEACLRAKNPETNCTTKNDSITPWTTRSIGKGTVSSLTNKNNCRGNCRSTDNIQNPASSGICWKC